MRSTALVGLVAGSLALGACGSDDEGGASEGGTADVAGAQKAVDPYIGKASAFPVEEPLAKRPKGQTYSYLQCVTPICGLFADILPGAAKTMGVKLDIVKAGGSADQLQNAMNSIIAKKPAAVLLPAVEPDTINNQLRELDGMGTPVVSNGIMNHEKYGIDAAMFNTKTAEISGDVLAGWSVKEKKAKADVVFYTTPELSFGPVMEKSFKASFKKYCASCKARFVDVPVTTIGNTAPSRVVSDLQANPDTNVVAFSTLEAAVGLPAALKTAGLTEKIEVIGFGPNPANLQDIKSGALRGGFGLDLAVMLWTQVDAAARLSTDSPLTALEEKGIPPLQFVESKDIKGDPSMGFTGYPDFPARFAKLWSAGT